MTAKPTDTERQTASYTNPEPPPLRYHAPRWRWYDGRARAEFLDKFAAAAADVTARLVDAGHTVEKGYVDWESSDPLSAPYLTCILNGSRQRVAWFELRTSHPGATGEIVAHVVVGSLAKQGPYSPGDGRDMSDGERLVWAAAFAGALSTVPLDPAAEMAWRIDRPQYAAEMARVAVLAMRHASTSGISERNAGGEVVRYLDSMLGGDQ